MLSRDVMQRFCLDVGVVNLAATGADFQELLVGDGHGANPQQRAEPYSRRLWISVRNRTEINRRLSRMADDDPKVNGR